MRRMELIMPNSQEYPGGYIGLTELASLLYDAPASAVANGQSYETVHTFYGYPNDLAANTTYLSF